jgi:adenylate cyclase
MRNLLQALTAKGAGAVAFDILFDEPDRMSLEQIAKTLPPEQAEALAGVIKGGPTNDEAFAAALKSSPSITAVVLTNQSDQPFGVKAGYAHAGDDPKPFLPAFSGVSPPLKIIQDAAVGSGAINWIPDRDHIVRRAELMFRVGDTMVPSLVAEALRVAQGASTYLIKSSNASGETAFGRATGLNNIKIGDLIIPTEGDGGITVKFRRTNPQAFIPAWKVLAGEVPADEINGRIMLIGLTAQGTVDIRSTPLDTTVPGVEIHAQLLEHILAGRELTRPDFMLGVEVGVVLALGGILAIGLPGRRPWAFGAISFIAVALVLAGGLAAYLYLGMLFDPVYAILAMLCLIAFIIAYIYRHMNVQRDEIRSIFMPPAPPAPA